MITLDMLKAFRAKLEADSQAWETSASEQTQPKQKWVHVGVVQGINWSITELDALIEQLTPKGWDSV